MRDRSAFGYMEPKPDISDFAQCGTCQSWLRDKRRCYWLGKKDEISFDDSCILYVQGDPLEKANVYPTGSVEPKDVGFVHGNVRCQHCSSFDDGASRCNLFGKLNGAFPKLFDLDDRVRPKGCCNAFDFQTEGMSKEAPMSVEAIAKYLEKHAPEIAALLAKDATVGDVHVPSALTGISVGYTQEDEPREKPDADPSDEDQLRAYESEDGAEQEDAIVIEDGDDDDDDVLTLDDDAARKPRNAGGDVSRFKMMKERAEGLPVIREPAEKRWIIDVRKAVPEERKVFGWASVSALNGVEVVDKQDDIVPIEELEKAAHEFTLYSRAAGDMHERVGVGQLIESVIFNAEKRACGLSAVDDKGQIVDGWFVGFKINDDATWDAFRSGARPEFSIGGKALRQDT